MSFISVLFRKQPVERDEDDVSRALHNDIGNLKESIGRLTKTYNTIMNEQGVADAARGAMHHRNDRGDRR